MAEKDKQADIYYFGYFNKLYESWEKSTHKVMDIWMNSPLMEGAVEKSSELKNYVNNFMESTLEKRCLPEQGDMEKIFDTIDNLHEKVSDLENEIEKLKTEAKKAKTSGTRKTRAKTETGSKKSNK